MGHGHAGRKRTPEYMAWQNMVQRCTNAKFRQYKDYGGRGVTVFAGWLGPGGFDAFFAEIGLRPSRDHSWSADQALRAPLRRQLSRPR
jgi:hypothetical protein